MLRICTFVHMADNVIHRVITVEFLTSLDSFNAVNVLPFGHFWSFKWYPNRSVVERYQCYGAYSSGSVLQAALFHVGADAERLDSSRMGYSRSWCKWCTMRWYLVRYRFLTNNNCLCSDWKEGYGSNFRGNRIELKSVVCQLTAVKAIGGRSA